MTTHTDCFATLLEEIRSCTLCAKHLPHGPRPVLQADADARILLAGQAPGRKVHETGMPFTDASGDRLRSWLGIERDVFYSNAFAIIPMGFCFPGSGKNGDLPPRAECAAHWRSRLLTQLPNVQLTIVIGRYAIDWHLPGWQSVTECVRSWQDFFPAVIPLPHPSPRNTLWLIKNPWFASELLPQLHQRVSEVLDG